MPLLPAFSNHLVSHSRIVSLGPSGVSGPYVLAVVDQLLVHNSVADHVVKTLNTQTLPNALGPHPSQQIGTVFEGIGAVSPLDDVAIVRVSGLTKTSLIGNVPAIFAIAVDLGRTYGRRLVSPNHVLVPAPVEGAGCPYGPPRHIPSVSLAPPAPGESTGVTIVDAGYNDWWPPHRGKDKNGPLGGWRKPNPLGQVGHIASVHRADWLDLKSNLVALRETVPTTGNWRKGTADTPSANTRGVLDMLAGHANFVAGVVGQHCEMPYLHIWSHRGSFIQKGTGIDEFPVEASVCRSIVQSQLANPTGVIHGGFAFPIKPETSHIEHFTPEDFDQLSIVWDTTFASLPQDPKPIFVCPAGNEGVTTEYFPAALATKFKGTSSGPLFENVKGVASLHPDTFAPSSFTNRGPWVQCSAVGENVESTFIPVGPLRCEAGSKNSREDFRKTSWAVWSGTSFAAPKVVGAVAARLPTSASPADAWDQLVKVYGAGGGPDPEVGRKLTNL